MKIAVLDLGTNTFHLLIAELADRNSWRKVLHRKITVKLGQGGIHKNVIAPAAFRRGIAAIAKFSEAIGDHGVTKVFAFGTAALRTSSNGHEFLRISKEEYGIEIVSISGDEEASLIHAGVAQAVALNREPAMIMDIGGGSTEFIICDQSGVMWKQSFKLGASLLLEKFRPSDPVTEGELQAINDFLSAELVPMLHAFEMFRPVRLIGSAGSFETFASMIRHRFPASGSHYGKKSHPIAVDQFSSLHRDIVASTKSERGNMRGLIKMRVDMIVPASILLSFVLEATGINDMILSSYSLKEGVVAGILKDELIRKNNSAKHQL